MEILQNKIFLVTVTIIALYHVISSLYMSREIMVWVPDKKRKIKLLLLVWLIPIFGLRIANDKAKLGLNKPTQNSSSDSSLSVGLLEIESIFNPGVKHRVEAVQEHKVKVAKKNEQQDP